MSNYKITHYFGITGYFCECGNFEILNADEGFFYKTFLAFNYKKNSHPSLIQCLCCKSAPNVPEYKYNFKKSGLFALLNSFHGESDVPLWRNIR